MHPSEMKNAALAAAARAEQDGFSATARALLQLANVCAGEARQLVKPVEQDRQSIERNSPVGRAKFSVVSH